VFWLVYRQGKARCIFIAKAHSLMFARLKASMAADTDAHFVEGYELLRAIARRVPASAVERLMPAHGAAALLKRVEGE
jgi:hypothetical protein